MNASSHIKITSQAVYIDDQGKKIESHRVDTNLKEETVTFTFPEPLQQKTTGTLSLNFNGQIRTDASGFYRIECEW